MTPCPFCAKRVEGEAATWCELIIELDEPTYFTAHVACIGSAFHQSARQTLGLIR
jgi:hypothetical protein